jgi:hypothetical protein
LLLCGDASKLLKRPRGDVDLKVGGQSLLERGLLHAQPIGVGGYHLQPPARRGDQDACQHRPGLVTRSGARDLKRGRHKCLRRDRDEALPIRLGELGEVLAAKRSDVKYR